MSHWRERSDSTQMIHLGIGLNFYKEWSSKLIFMYGIRILNLINRILYFYSLDVRRGKMKNYFYIIWSTYFLTEFGRSMYFVTITWLLYKLTNDPAYTGLLVGMGFLPGLILNIFVGVIVDRHNRKYLAISANLIATIAIIIIFISESLQLLQPLMIIIVHMLLQITGSLYRPSMQAFTTEMFEEKQLPKVFSQTGAAIEVGSLLGASIGGIVLASTSTKVTIGMVLICFSLATTALFFLKGKKLSEVRSTNSSIFTDLVDGFKYLRTNQFLWGLFANMFVGQLIFHTSVAFLSVYTKEFLKQPVSIYGFLDATISIGGIAAGLLGTWWWKVNKNFISVRSLIIISFGLIFIGIYPLLPLAFLGIFLIGLGTTWIRVLLQSVQQIATEPQYHGRMASYRMICNQGSVVISGPILGWIASNYGVNNAYLGLIIPAILCLGFSTLHSKHKKFIKITHSA
ncbi:MFS transporter [Priestia megaterium]|nr:MFS transporter [Priestia megaterium]